MGIINNVGDTGNGSGITNGHTLTLSEIPAHTHSSAASSIALLSRPVGGSVWEAATLGTSTGSAGGNGSHSHVLSNYKPKHYSLAYIMKL